MNPNPRWWYRPLIVLRDFFRDDLVCFFKGHRKAPGWNWGGTKCSRCWRDV